MENATHDLSRYAAMVKALAQHAIEIAVDASPHQPGEGEYWVSMTHALPIARRLLGESVDLEPVAQEICRAAAVVEPLILAEESVEGVVKFVDGRGHARSVYGYLFLDLFDQALDDSVITPTGHAESLLSLSLEALTVIDINRKDSSLMLWGEVGSFRSTHPDFMAEQISQSTDFITSIVGAPGKNQSLQEQALDDSPDEWTYRELVGLHTLHAIVMCSGYESWQQRILEITAYHQYHTQPDYTTYQPWGLAAFLSNPETIMFGEQQLHDVQTHLQIEGGPGAVLPALLLADAYASLESMSQSSTADE